MLIPVVPTSMNMSLLKRYGVGSITGSVDYWLSWPRHRRHCGGAEARSRDVGEPTSRPEALSELAVTWRAGR